MSDKCRKKLNSVLTKEYMSSEDESEDDEGRKVFTIRQLPWRSDKISRVFNCLDADYMDSCTKRSRDFMIKRVMGANSTRSPPKNAPSYIIKK